MKKTLLFLFLGTICSLNAQNTHMLGLTVGVGSPMGKFAKQGDSATGYANSGLTYTINYDYATSKNWGGYFTFINQSFGFDADNYTRSNDPDFTRTEYFGFNYNIKSLNYGASYIINKNHKFSVTPKLGMGISIIRANAVGVNYRFLGSDLSVTEAINSTAAVNYNFGFDFTFRKSVESQLSYYVKTYWQTSSPELNHTTTTKIDGQLFDKTISKYTQSMGYSSFSVGVRYILKRK
jgi:hypothetical protein